MDRVSAFQHSLNLDLKVRSKKKGSIRKTGDGEGQMRLGYIAADEEEHDLTGPSEQALRSDGYTVQLQSNTKVRQYSGNIQRLNRRVGSLNTLKDNLEGVQTAGGELKNHLARAAGDLTAHLKDAAELITLATELEGHRRAAHGAVRELREEGVVVEYPESSVRLDLGDVDAATISLQQVSSSVRTLSQYVSSQLHGAEEQISSLVSEKIPRYEESFEEGEPSGSKSGDPLIAFAREIHNEMIEAGRQVLNSQANLDPVRAYQLLGE